MFLYTSNIVWFSLLKKGKHYPKVLLEKNFENIFWRNMKNFGFWVFESSSSNITIFFLAFHSLKYKNSFLLRKFRKFFNIRVKKFAWGSFYFLSMGWKVQGSISGNTRNFLILESKSLGLKVCLVPAYYTTTTLQIFLKSFKIIEEFL